MAGSVCESGKTPPVTFGDSPLKEGAFLREVARRAGESKKSPLQQERGFLR